MYSAFYLCTYSLEITSNTASLLKLFVRILSITVLLSDGLENKVGLSIA